MLEPLRVLLIGPAESAPFQAIRHLKSHYQVTSLHAKDILAARDALDRENWDILLADCTTPEWQADGAARLTCQDGGAPLPLISISRSAGQAAAAAAARAGAFGYARAHDGPRLRFVVAQMLGMVREQTERQRLSQIVDVLTRGSVQGILIIGRDWKIHYVNDALPRMIGYTLGELTAMDPTQILALIYPEDVESVLEHYQNYIRGAGGVYHLIVRVFHRDGSLRWLDMFVTELLWQAIPSFHATALDITDQIMTRQALDANDKMLRLALEAISAGVWEWSMKDDHAYWSAENYRVLGYEPGSVTAKYAHWLRAVHPDDRAAAEAEVQRCVREDCPLDIEFRVVWPDGSTHWIENIGQMQHDASGAVTGMIGIQIDITAHRQSEIEKRDAEETLRALLSSLPAEIASHDLDGRIDAHAVHPPVSAASDLSTEKRLSELVSAVNLERLVASVRQVAETGLPVGVEDTVQSEGATYYLHHELYPIRDTVGRITAVGRVTRDITEKHHIEEALERNLREMAAMYAVTSALNVSLQPEEWLFTVFDILEKFLHADAAWAVLDNGQADGQMAIGSSGLGASVVHAGLLTHVATCDVCAPPQDAPPPISHASGPCVRMHRDILRPLGISSVTTFRLYNRDSYLGLLGIAWVQPHTLSEVEQTTLDAITQQVALALHNARLYRRARQTSQLRILNDLNRAVTATMDPGARVETILEHAANAFDTSVTILTLTEPMSAGFPARSCVRGTGWIDSAFAREAIRDGAAFLMAISARHEAVVASISDVAYMANHPQAESFANAHTMLAPVVSDGEMVAVIILARTSAAQPFTEEDRALAIAIADVAAGSIRSATLYATEQNQRRAAEALLSISSLLTSTLDSDALLQGILNSVSHVLPYDVCTIMRFESEYARIIGIQVGPQQSVDAVSAVAGLSLEGAYALRLPISSIPGLAELAETRQPIIVPDMNYAPEKLTQPWMMWVRSAANIPILVGGQLIGCLNLVSSAPRTYSAEQITTMTTFAAQVGAALYNAQLFQESDARARRLAVIASVTASAISSLDLEVVLNLILETACHALSADLAVLIIRDGGPKTLIVAHERATGESWSREEAIQATGLLGYALEHDQALRVDDLPHDPRFDPVLDVQGRHGLTALICSPLTFHNTFSGALALARGQERPFNEGELHLLQSLAPMVALATANARLYRASRFQAEEMALVSEFGLQLARSLDSHAIARDMQATLKAYLKADVLILFDYDAARDLLVAWIDPHDADAALHDLRLPAGKSIAGWALRHREAALVDDVRHDPRAVNVEDFRDIEAQRSLMAVPFYGTGGSNGVVVAGARQPGAFSARELSLFQSLVSFLAVTLENARLYEQSRSLLEERARTQAVLVQNEKMAALGRLTASVAHEINNPIQAILGFVSLAQEELEGNGGIQTLNRYLGIVEDEIDRIAITVERMREFYRPDRSTVGKTDVHMLLRFVLQLTARKLQECGIRVKEHWGDDLPEIEANADQLKQVFLNLVLNAIDAMPGGGTLTITTSSATLEPQVGGYTSDDPVPSVRIEIRDTGAGIPEDVLSQIFEPFFTTKQHGSGLGLSISYGIVAAHRGYIAATSEMGEGTCFVVHFPVG